MTMRTENPLISVVTIVRNDRKNIERTIASVLEQTYRHIEHIIIDGASTDGTVDIIKRYADRIAFWSSEPDRGIYDAMNKGIDRARGEWVLFLNAGDRITGSDVISRLMKEVPQDADVLYGGHEEDFGTSSYAVRPAGRLEDLWKGMICSHQAMVVRTSLMKRYKFNIAHRIAADYELVFTLYQQRCRFYRTPLVISRVLADGFSASRNLRLTFDQWRIARRFDDRSLTLDLYHFGKFVGVFCKNVLKKALPVRLAAYLRSR